MIVAKLLAKKLHAGAVHFSYSKLGRLAVLHRYDAVVEGGLAQITPKPDLCTTRVAARRSLFFSMVRLHKGLKLYAREKKCAWEMDDAEWQAVTEFLAIFDIAHKVATLVQTEQLMVSSLALILKEEMMSNLRGDSLTVVELNKVTKSPRLPRVKVARADLTALGEVGLKRATLEGERRYCGNTTEELTGLPVVLMDRDKLGLLLDPRTLNCAHIAHRPGLKEECLALLEEEYVRFGLRAREFKAEAEAALQAKEAARFERAGKAAAGKAAAGKAAAGKQAAVADPVVAAAAPAPARMAMAWSEDEDESECEDEGEMDAEAAAAAALETTIAELKAEFKTVFKNWRRQAGQIDWRALSEVLELGLVLPTDRELTPLDLWEADMGKVLKHVFINADKSGHLFGYLPKMATTSRGSIAQNTAVSFCERINSAANQTVTKGNTLLGPDEVNMLTVLRVNRKFMAYMRKRHPKASEQHFNMTVVSSEDNAADSDPEGE
jgi:hypothetical protein